MPKKISVDNMQELITSLTNEFDKNVISKAKAEQYLPECKESRELVCEGSITPPSFSYDENTETVYFNSGIYSITDTHWCDTYGRAHNLEQEYDPETQTLNILANTNLFINLFKQD